MAYTTGPNPLAVGLSILKARRVAKPAPRGKNVIDHAILGAVLDDLGADGISALADSRDRLRKYRESLEATEPDELTRFGSLAFWMNLYNAGALDLAAETNERGESSVLRVAGGFSRPWATVSGEALSLEAIEHGKIRRFGDPRIHGGLVCGSASCPTLRYEPFRADGLDGQLDEQMSSFLAGGGAFADQGNNRLLLSRVFLWYGADFTRPNRMPTLWPARKSAIADALGRWLADDIESWRITAAPHVAFQPYDWSLACKVR